MDTETKSRICVPTAAFTHKGGWALDTQFAEQVGSPYLLAHGLGVPVLDACTDVDLPGAGAWRVWVRTRNWVPGVGEPPGRFQVLLDGRPLAPVFGTAPDEWGWADGGAVEVASATVRVALRDLTGFDGRCAAVAFTRDECQHAIPPLPKELCGLRASVRDLSFDLVVVGGGIAGTCAALAAARQGLAVALIHDRPVLGGNASQEVRVWCGGEARHPLVREVRNRFMNREPGAAHSDRVRMRLVQDEPTLALFAGWRACGVAMSGDGTTVAAVEARQTETGALGRFHAPLFVDATGDGWVGYWAGADYRMGREAAAEHGESMAPQQADKRTLGCSLLWTSSEANTDMPFGPLPWAEPAAQGVAAVEGEWNWEYGLDRDTLRDAEAIRDHLLRVIYGSFSLAKREGKNARKALDFVPYNLGKRESRRLLGDVILTENDVRGQTPFPDAVATGTWSIDLHENAGGADFLTVCRQPLFGRYFIPLRALYSRNVRNLLMAGRCFSATHVGLGSPRVMNTTGQMGVAAGCAAAVCRRHALLPREVASDTTRMSELQDLIGGAFPGHPDPRHVCWHIVDETDAGRVTVSGEWNKGLHENGDHYGSGFLYCEKGHAEAWVAYALPVGEAARYRLRILWNTYWDGRADAVPVRITHAEGVARVTVDMNRGSGLWHELGEYPLAPGRPAEIRIETEGTRGIVVADAVAMERAGAA
jgi:hypothetical protein